MSITNPGNQFVKATGTAPDGSEIYLEISVYVKPSDAYQVDEAVLQTELQNAATAIFGAALIDPNAAPAAPTTTTPTA